MMQNKKKFDRIGQKPHLKIKCKPDKCSCSTKKRKHFLPKERRKNRRFRYLKKKNNTEDFEKPIDVSFARKKGHVAKQCPSKTKQSAKMIQQIHSSEPTLDPDTNVQIQMLNSIF
ncbi:hypothetical protein ACOSP7_022883 [Xanthoceras sorbifolium]